MNNVLIAGGSGFVGANLVRRFKKLGYKVIVLVSKEVSLWRLSDLLFSVEIVRVDFSNFKALREIVEYHRPGIVINTVSQSEFYNEHFSEKIYKVNFEGPANLLRACMLVGFDVFITLGSSEEYGLTEGLISEEALPKPISDYGVAKNMMTTFALKYAYSKGLPVYCIRPFSIYGDYSPREKLISNLFLNAYKNSTVTLKAPENIRDFLYIDDFVDLIMLVTQKKPKNQYLFNAGTGISFKVRDVIQKIKEIVNADIRIEWTSLSVKEANPRLRFSDSTLANKVLSWVPRHSLDQGLQLTNDWFNRNYSLYESDECLTELAGSVL